MIESVLLALLGGVLGLVLSLWGVDWLVTSLPADVPRITGLWPDWRVGLVTFGAALLTGILCGPAPALSTSRNDLSAAIGGRGVTSGRGRLRNILVVGEIAVALILLVGAGLMLKSFWLLPHVDPGFDYRNVLTAKIVLAPERYKEAAKSHTFYNSLLANLKRLPGVAQVSLAQSIPLASTDNGTNFDIVSHPYPKGQQPEARLRFIGLDYFSTINLARLNGRDFTDRDEGSVPPVVMVNEAFARQYLKGEDPLGKKLLLGWGGDAAKEIVGVVGNVRPYPHTGRRRLIRSSRYATNN